MGDELVVEIDKFTYEKLETAEQPKQKVVTKLKYYNSLLTRQSKGELTFKIIAVWTSILGLKYSLYLLVDYRQKDVQQQSLRAPAHSKEDR